MLFISASPANDDYGINKFGRNGKNNRDWSQDSVKVLPLKFRCYQAHIPYTIQLLKDHSLSGMDHVKVGDRRFRGPLPRSARGGRGRTAALGKKKGAVGEVRDGNTAAAADPALFLEGNVDGDLMW